MALSSGTFESSKELLDAQAHIRNHIFKFTKSLSLKCAIELGIPDAIHKHGKPITLSQLAHALSINKAKSDALFRLMRILVHSKFFDKVKNEDKDEEEAYCLTRASRLLLKDEPLSSATYAIAMIDPIIIDPFHHMSEWFRDDNTAPFVTKFGKDFWEYTGSEHKWNQLFNESLACDARLMTSILVKEYRQVFEGMATMVDVGGGTGSLARGIVAAFPGSKCMVLDLPHVVAGLDGSENLSYVGGDIFESIPQTDAAFLQRVLHNWNGEECIQILKKCKEAITPSKNNGKKVIIVEMVVDEEKEEYETQLFLDVVMLTEVRGKERTEKEWRALFLAAGFQKYKITPILDVRSIIEVFP